MQNYRACKLFPQLLSEDDHDEDFTRTLTSQRQETKWRHEQEVLEPIDAGAQLVLGFFSSSCVSIPEWMFGPAIKVIFVWVYVNDCGLNIHVIDKPSGQPSPVLRTGGHSESLSALEAHEVLQKKRGRSWLVSMLIPVAISAIDRKSVV